MNDDELEGRLTRWQPAAAPPELLRSLRALTPTSARRVRWFWPLAYAGLSTAWIFILVLRLLTPTAEPAPSASPTAAIAADVSSPTSALTMERSFLLRANPD